MCVRIEESFCRLFSSPRMVRAEQTGRRIVSRSFTTSPIRSAQLVEIRLSGDDGLTELRAFLRLRTLFHGGKANFEDHRAALVPVQNVARFIDEVLLAAGQRDRAFDHVLQFAHIARPGIINQQCRRGLGNSLYLLPAASRAVLKERVNQQRNILAPFTERRHENLDHVEPVV